MSNLYIKKFKSNLKFVKKKKVIYKWFFILMKKIIEIILFTKFSKKIVISGFEVLSDHVQKSQFNKKFSMILSLKISFYLKQKINFIIKNFLKKKQIIFSQTKSPLFNFLIFFSVIKGYKLKVKVKSYIFILNCNAFLYKKNSSYILLFQKFILYFFFKKKYKYNKMINYTPYFFLKKKIIKKKRSL